MIIVAELWHEAGQIVALHLVSRNKLSLRQYVARPASICDLIFNE